MLKEKSCMCLQFGIYAQSLVLVAQGSFPCYGLNMKVPAGTLYSLSQEALQALKGKPPHSSPHLNPRSHSHPAQSLTLGSLAGG